LCSSNSCSMLTESWEKLRRHRLSCLSTSARPAFLEPKPAKSSFDQLVSCPKTCSQCPARFTLDITLQIHTSAKHRPRSQTCVVGDCQFSQEKTLFNQWEILSHTLMYHKGKSYQCPIVWCSYINDSKSSPWPQMMYHLAARHSLFCTSVQALLQCELEEVFTWHEMIERGKVYIHISHYTWTIAKSSPWYVYHGPGVTQTGGIIQTLPARLRGDPPAAERAPDPGSCSEVSYRVFEKVRLIIAYVLCPECIS
jgi:hypothetical protein